MNSKAQTLNERLQHLADQTKSFLAQGNIEAARACISEVEQEYCNADLPVRNLIANNYILSVSQYMESHDPDLVSLFPISFLIEFYW